ncbi:MAG: MaoC/PaaZ C-terminal domain-containing protein [Kiloniellales bacterium]
MTVRPETPTLCWGPITRTDLVRYAGASGDFNPIHHDVPFARAAGMPDVMAQGMYSAGLVASALERWFGQSCLLSYRVRFRAPVWPGDRLVARCDELEELEGGRAKVKVTFSRGDDELVLAATASLRLSEEVPS